MLGEGIEVEITEPILVSQGLYPEELRYIAGAVSKRRLSLQPRGYVRAVRWPGWACHLAG